MEFTRMLFLALGLTIAAAWANDDPFTGSWKMQVKKTKGVRPDVQTFTQTADGYNLVWQHKSLTLNMSLKLDGQDRPIPAEEFTILQKMRGQTYSHARKGNTIETTFRLAGSPVGTLRREVSADGRAMTMTLDGKDTTGGKLHDISVWAKQ
jgi:hypothetical protein